MQEEVSKEKILSFLEELKPSLQKEGIKKIGLFGSYAKGYAQKSSDIDVVIVADKEIFKKRKRAYETAEFFNQIRENISSKFNKEVDLCSIFSKENLNKTKDFLQGAIYV